MSAKQTIKIQVEWNEDKLSSIPINAQLAKDSSEVYPFAFVSSEEFYLGQGQGERGME